MSTVLSLSVRFLLDNPLRSLLPLPGGRACACDDFYTRVIGMKSCRMVSSPKQM